MYLLTAFLSFYMYTLLLPYVTAFLIFYVCMLIDTTNIALLDRFFDFLHVYML